MSSRNKQITIEIGLVFLILVIALAVRFWVLKDKAVSMSEITYWQPAATSESLKELLFHHVSLTQSHQPGYILIPYLMKTFTESIRAVRCASLLIGLVSLWFTFRFVSGFFSRKTAWTVTALLAISPFHAFYSTDLSPYSLYYLVTILAFHSLLAGLTKGDFKFYILFAAINVTGLLIHYETIGLMVVQILAGTVYAIFGQKGGQRKSTLKKLY